MVHICLNTNGIFHLFVRTTVYECSFLEMKYQASKQASKQANFIDIMVECVSQIAHTLKVCS